jgi:hypothetical protein
MPSDLGFGAHLRGMGAHRIVGTRRWYRRAGTQGRAELDRARQWHTVDRVQPILLRRGSVAAFSSWSAPARTVGEGHAMAGAGCRQCGAVPDCGGRTRHALVNAIRRLRSHRPSDILDRRVARVPRRVGAVVNFPGTQQSVPWSLTKKNRNSPRPPELVGWDVIKGRFRCSLHSPGRAQP